MKKTLYSGASGLVLLTGLLAAGSAFAADPPAQPNTVAEVVVTGSLIAGTPEDAALPVDVIGAEELQRQGSPSTLDLIKGLSVSSGVLGDTNQFDTRAQGSEGSGSINLRGLGAQRTLVLFNGRRMPVNPFGQAASGIVDTNIIPSAAIGRVEVLKDGAAATYGSDAIGGVVNFITKTNFNGLEAGGSYRMIDGSDGDYTANVVWGWAGDNANILLTAGYQHRSKLPVTERDWASKTFAENPQGGWSGGNAIGRFAPVSAAGSLLGGLTTDTGCVGLGGVLVGGVCQFHFIPYDNMVEKEDRFQLYGEVNADLNEDHKFHAELLYSETDVPDWNTSPSYLALQTSYGSASNPVTGGLLTVPGYFVPNTNPGYIAYSAANPGQINPAAAGIQYLGVQYRPFSYGGNPAFNYGPSVGERTYTAFRTSAGLKGKFSNGLNYDVALTYGQEEGTRFGYDSVAALYQLALRGYGSLASDKSGDSVGGCTAAETANYTTNAGNTALGCYYFNPFSNSAPANSITGVANPNYNAAVANSADLTRWFFRRTSTAQVSRLFVLDAAFSGQTGIELAGGNVAWALAFQYRKDFFQSTYDNLTNLAVTPCIDTPLTGTTNCAVKNGPFLFLGGGSESNLNGDVFAYAGELAIPVTDDLQVQLAARYEDYGGRTGSTFDPKISIRYQATDFLAFRGSVGSTFRGPARTSLAPGSVTSLSFLGGSFRAVDVFGNPDLAPESAMTYSAGVILNVGSLKATLDWWKFNFDNPIVAESGTSIFTKFFSNAANCTDPAYAGLKSRITLQGACAAANVSRVKTFAVNGPPVSTSGVDLLADYRMDDVWGGAVKVGTSMTYTLDYKVEPFTVEGVVVESGYDAVGKLNYQLFATSLPKLKGSVYAEYTRGDHNLRWTVNYVDSYVDQRTTIVGAGKTIDKWITHDLAYRAFLPYDITFTAVIDNVLDEDPPFARLDLSYDPFTASGLGRTVKIGAVKKF